MDTMQSLQRDGLFWLPNNPERRVGGQLTFDPQHGLQLQLFGSLQSIEFPESSGIPHLNVHGVTKQGEVTLHGCFVVKAELTGDEVLSETYRPESVLDGEHVNDVESLRFERANIGLFDLSEWVWKSGITREHEDSQSSGVGRVTKIVYTPPENQNIDTEFGQLGLTQRADYDSSGTRRFSLQTTRLIHLAFSEPVAIDRITRIAGSLQDMLTICTGKPSSVESVAVARLDSQQYMGVLRNMIGPETQNLKDSHPAEMWLTFDDAGGLDFMRQWLMVNARYGIVARLLVDHLYHTSPYVDVRFLNAVIAAEAFLRVRAGKRKFKLHKGLQELASESNSIAKDLVGDIEKWARNVVQTRRDVVHRSVEEGKRPDYFALANSLYWIVTMSMFRECGVSEYALAKIAKNRWFEYVASSLRWPNSRV